MGTHLGLRDEWRRAYSLRSSKPHHHSAGVPEKPGLEGREAVTRSKTSSFAVATRPIGQSSNNIRDQVIVRQVIISLFWRSTRARLYLVQTRTSQFGRS